MGHPRLPRRRRLGLHPSRLRSRDSPGPRHVLGEPVAPKSATAARKLPDYDAPFGWRAAIQKEMDRVEAFGGWEKADREHFAEGASFDQIYTKR